MKTEQKRIGFNFKNTLARTAALGILAVGPIIGCGADSGDLEDADSLLQGGGSHGPSRPICDEGDTDLAYNAMPYGVVDCGSASVGFQASQAQEFGDEVALAGRGRRLVSLKVLFNSWACQTGHWSTGNCQTMPGAKFPHDITATFYRIIPCASPNQTVSCKGPQIASVTNMAQPIPFRPSANSACTGANAGRWYNAAAGVCRDYIGTVLTFNFPSNLLPDEVIWTVGFRTTNYGTPPMGPLPCSLTPEGCPYDSLNVGAQTYGLPPFAGTDVDTSGTFFSSINAGQYCPTALGLTNPGPVGTLRLDTPCWRPYRPLGAIKTKR